jgi:L-idonate 5-dehydrogenase
MRAFQIAGKLDGKVLVIPTPEPKSDEVRLKIAYVGICGSDLHYYFDGANGAFVVKEPLVPGHEISGTVDLDPSGTFSQGTKVTIHPATFGNCEPGLEDKPHLWPGGGYLGSASTHPHTQGAMSEYFIVKREKVRMLPDSLDLKVASLSEPLGVALHAINIAGGVTNKEVLVSGSGPIGLMVIAAAKVLGAKSITATDVLPNALERAKVLGANSLINVSNQEVPQNSFDLVFECSAAAPAVTSALLSVKRAGTVVQLGMMGAQGQSVGLAPLVAKEITWKGSFRFNGEVDQAIEMLSANNWIGQAISHTFDLDDAMEAFEIAKDSAKSGKVLVQVQ